MSNPKHSHHDVIIVGGGITALTLGALLAEYTELTVAILEQQAVPTTWPAGSIDPRVSAISPGVKRIFDALHCWEAIQTEGIAPYPTMQVWEQSNPKGISFDCRDCGEPYLGYIIENRVMRKTLFNSLQVSPQVTWLCPKKPTGLTVEEKHVTLTCEDDHSLTGQLLVGADGARSWCRQTLNIPVQETPYGHHALVTTVRTENPHHQTPSQVFLPTGPLAFLPLKDKHLCSIVWSTNPKQCESLKALPEPEFLNALTEAFEYKFGKITACLTPRLSFPLIHRKANNRVQPRVALIGDAAHTIHPLAGQGLNLGMLDSASLVEVLLRATQKQQDIGGLHTLRPFERWRASENALTTHTVNCLKQLYEQQNPAIKLARSLGLAACNGIPPLKAAFMEQAMNLRGHQPNFLESLKGT